MVEVEGGLEVTSMSEAEKLRTICRMGLTTRRSTRIERKRKYARERKRQKKKQFVLFPDLGHSICSVSRLIFY